MARILSIVRMLTRKLLESAGSSKNRVEDESFDRCGCERLVLEEGLEPPRSFGARDFESQFHTPETKGIGDLYSIYAASDYIELHRFIGY